MDIQNYGLLLIVIGILLLIFSIYANTEWLQYLSVAVIVVGGLLINYKKILRKR